MLSEEDRKYKEPDWLRRLLDDFPEDNERRNKVVSFFTGTTTLAFLAMVPFSDENEGVRIADVWPMLVAIVASFTGMLFSSQIADVFLQGPSYKKAIFDRWMRAQAKADAWSREWTEEQISELKHYIEMLNKIRRHFDEEAFDKHRSSSWRRAWWKLTSGERYEPTYRPWNLKMLFISTLLDEIRSKGWEIERRKQYEE